MSRILIPNVYRYPVENEATYGVAKLPDTLHFFFQSRDAPSLENELQRHRKNFDKLSSTQSLERPPREMMLSFLKTLAFFREKFEAACRGDELSNSLLKTLSPISALKEQWRLLNYCKNNCYPKPKVFEEDIRVNWDGLCLEFGETSFQSIDTDIETTDQPYNSTTVTNTEDEELNEIMENPLAHARKMERVAEGDFSMPIFLEDDDFSRAHVDIRKKPAEQYPAARRINPSRDQAQAPAVSLADESHDPTTRQSDVTRNTYDVHEAVEAPARLSDSPLCIEDEDVGLVVAALKDLQYEGSIPRDAPAPAATVDDIYLDNPMALYETTTRHAPPFAGHPIHRGHVPTTSLIVGCSAEYRAATQAFAPSGWTANMDLDAAMVSTEDAGDVLAVGHDGSQIIQPWQAVLGDKQAANKSTAARNLLYQTKQRYKEMQGVGSDTERFQKVMVEYFDALAKEFPRHDTTGPFFLIYCSKSAVTSGRAETVNTHKYAGDSNPEYGIAKYPQAVEFYFKSRDTVTPGEVLRKCRREVNEILLTKEQEAKSPMVLHFVQQLESVEQIYCRWEEFEDDQPEKKFLEKTLKKGVATLKVLRKDLKPFMKGDKSESATSTPK